MSLMRKRVRQDKSDVELFYELLALGPGDRLEYDLLFEILLRIYAVGLGIQRDEDGFFETREQYENRRAINLGPG